MTHHARKIDRSPVYPEWYHARRDELARHSRTAPTEAAALRFAAIAALGLLTAAIWLVPNHLVLPSVSSASLAIAALLALVASRLRAAQDTDRFNLWDASGLLVFVGCGAAILSEPQFVSELFSASSQRPGNAAP